jgi:hypothetical protein
VLGGEGVGIAGDDHRLAVVADTVDVAVERGSGAVLHCPLQVVSRNLGDEATEIDAQVLGLIAWDSSAHDRPDMMLGCIDLISRLLVGDL